MARQRDSVKARRVCFERYSSRDKLGVFLVCAVCHVRVDPVRKPGSWRADHYPIRWSQGGTDTADNLRVICLTCDAGPGGKAAEDTSQVAKAKRCFEKHVGIRRKKGFYKPKGAKFDWSRGTYTKETE
jgi:hypothetical protein